MRNTFYCSISCFRLFKSIQNNKRKPVKRGWAPRPPPDPSPLRLTQKPKCVVVVFLSLPIRVCKHWLKLSFEECCDVTHRGHGNEGPPVGICHVCYSTSTATTYEDLASQLLVLPVLLCQVDQGGEGEGPHSQEHQQQPKLILF